MGEIVLCLIECLEELLEICGCIPYIFFRWFVVLSARFLLFPVFCCICNFDFLSRPLHRLYLFLNSSKDLLILPLHYTDVPCI
jgi:hypothetical protein